MCVVHIFIKMGYDALRVDVEDNTCQEGTLIWLQDPHVRGKADSFMCIIISFFAKTNRKDPQVLYAYLPMKLQYSMQSSGDHLLSAVVSCPV